MKAKEFNQLKKQVKEGNVKGLKEVISDLTLRQAQAIEDLMYDIELTDEMNEVLDEIVVYIDSLINAEKVANKKLLKPEKTAKPEKEAPTKKDKEIKLSDRVNVGDTVYFRVEGEEINHPVLILFKGKKNIIAVMKENEDEGFLISKSVFNKQVFEWTDRKGETYNIIVTL
jgi:hypothetical protein